MTLPSHHSLCVALQNAGIHIQAQVYPSLDSTNTQARRMIESGEITGETPVLLLAHTQTAGRGRMGRRFHSPEASGLYFSYIYQSASNSDAPPVTPTAALATAVAIEESTGKNPLIKWVNDLYLDGKKICGILTEAVTTPSGDIYIIVGIGINITTASFPEGLRSPAGCLLTPEDSELDLSRLVADIIRHLTDYMKDPVAALQGYRARFMLTGKTVTYAYICAPDGGDTPETVTGEVQGITPDYSLLLRLDDGKILALGSGEVTSCGG